MKKMILGFAVLSLIALLGCTTSEVKVKVQDPIDPAILGKWCQNANGKGMLWEFRANGKLMMGSDMGGGLFNYYASNGKGQYGIKLNDSTATDFLYTFKDNKIAIYLPGKTIGFTTLPDQEYHFYKIN